MIATTEEKALEPLLSVEGVTNILCISRRMFERLRAAGKFPRPDIHIGKMPRWKPETVRRWIERGND
jgi:predicted DNA-binding transcriptional regulator AlpA